MKLVNLNLRDDVVADIDSIVKEFGFANRTEFIRAALRDRVEEYRTKKALLALDKMRGMFKDTPTSDEEYERNREEAFKELEAKLKTHPRV